jgi:hypothetical protein
VIYTTAISETRGSQWSKWEIRVSGRGWVHRKKGLKMIGITMIRVKRGIQWDRSQIRLSGRGSGPQKKIKNDRYHYDQGEERNPMG